MPSAACRNSGGAPVVISFVSSDTPHGGRAAKDLVHYRITAQLTRNGNAETHDKAVSHCFFSDQQLHRPGPNLS